MDKDIIKILNEAFDNNDIYFNSLQGCIEMTIGNLEEQLDILAFELEKLLNPELKKSEDERSKRQMEEFIELHPIDEDLMKELDEYYEKNPEPIEDIEIKEPTQEELTNGIDKIMNQISQWKMVYNKYHAEKQEYDKYFYVEPHPLFDCPNFDENHI